MPANDHKLYVFYTPPLALDTFKIGDYILTIGHEKIKNNRAAMYQVIPSENGECETKRLGTLKRECRKGATTPKRGS